MFSTKKKPRQFDQISIFVTNSIELQLLRVQNAKKSTSTADSLR